MGPSGCGKTTFLDLLAGRKKSGEIQVGKKGRDKGEEFRCVSFGETIRDRTFIPSG